MSRSPEPSGPRLGEPPPPPMAPSRDESLPVAEAEIRRERARARVLRASGWWKRRLARARCGYCGRPTPPRELTMDHRVPLVRGGRSTRGNLVPACKPCNNAKKSLLPIEWTAYLERLAQDADADTNP